MQLIAGIDEAGRGPLAGPVFAAAVILDPDFPIPGLADSKLLSAKKRESLAEKIRVSAKAWAIARAEVHEIDEINILQASMLAMQRAVNALSIAPELALIDGNKCPLLTCPAKAIIQGDKTVPEISAASILAKVARDADMLILDQSYPNYGFAQHKGYGTKQHLDALKKFGASPIHRLSFTPVRNVIS